MNPIPSYDAEATATLRDLDGQRLLDHLRNQRPDGAPPGEQIEPPRDEPLASAPAPRLSVAVFDRACVLKQLRLVGPGDEIGESGPSSSASSDEQGGSSVFGHSCTRSRCAISSSPMTAPAIA